MDNLALHKISYGLYILSTSVDGEPYGCVINTAFQITSSPPRIAVSCNLDNFTHQKITEAKTFGISVLAEDTAPELLATFGYTSGRDMDKFAKHPSYKVGPALSVPLFSDEAVATFECRLVDLMEVGTHTIFVGEVIDSTITRPNADEMTYRYYHEIRKGAAPKNAPTFIAEKESSESWECSLCGYIYDEQPPFEELDDEWVCPICGARKELFNKQ